MTQHLFRSIVDRAGRPWRVSEFFASAFAADLAADAGDAAAPVPLLFTSGNERRWVSHAPAHWWDVAEDRLIRLLDEARELPHWVASFAGLVDE